MKKLIAALALCLVASGSLPQSAFAHAASTSFLIVQLPALNSCTGTGGTLHASNTYTTAQTWSPTTNPHYLTGTQDFNTGSRLTIEPGTLICTDGGFIIFRAGSRLTAVGTAAAPIMSSAIPAPRGPIV